MASKREKIKLKSPETDYCCYTVKNKSNTQKRLELKKFDPKARKHLLFKESK